MAKLAFATSGAGVPILEKLGSGIGHAIVGIKIGSLLPKIYGIAGFPEVVIATIVSGYPVEIKDDDALFNLANRIVDFKVSGKQILYGTMTLEFSVYDSSGDEQYSIKKLVPTVVGDFKSVAGSPVSGGIEFTAARMSPVPESAYEFLVQALRFKI